MTMKPKEMVRLVKKQGYVQIPNNNGSHLKFVNPETGDKIIIAVHAKEMKKGTEQALLKQLGLK